MGDVGTEGSTNDAVPGWVELSVELLLNVGSDVLFDVVSFKSLEYIQEMGSSDQTFFVEAF